MSPYTFPSRLFALILLWQAIWHVSSAPTDLSQKEARSILDQSSPATHHQLQKRVTIQVTYDETKTVQPSPFGGQIQLAYQTTRSFCEYTVRPQAWNCTRGQNTQPTVQREETIRGSCRRDQLCYNGPPVAPVDTGEANNPALGNGPFAYCIDYSDIIDIALAKLKSDQKRLLDGTEGHRTKISPQLQGQSIGAVFTDGDSVLSRIQMDYIDLNAQDDAGITRAAVRCDKCEALEIEKLPFDATTLVVHAKAPDYAARGAGGNILSNALKGTFSTASGG